MLQTDSRTREPRMASIIHEKNIIFGVVFSTTCLDMWKYSYDCTISGSCRPWSRTELHGIRVRSRRWPLLFHLFPSSFSYYSCLCLVERPPDFPIWLCDVPLVLKRGALSFGLCDPTRKDACLETSVFHRKRYIWTWTFASFYCVRVCLFLFLQSLKAYAWPRESQAACLSVWKDPTRR